MTYQQYANGLCIRAKEAKEKLLNSFLLPRELGIEQGRLQAFGEAIELFKDATEVVDWDEAERKEVTIE